MGLGKAAGGAGLRGRGPVCPDHSCPQHPMPCLHVVNAPSMVGWRDGGEREGGRDGREREKREGGKERERKGGREGSSAQIEGWTNAWPPLSVIYEQIVCCLRSG